MSPFDPSWAAQAGPPGAAFCDAVLAAAWLAVDPVGLGGLVVRAWSGAARDGFVARLSGLFPAGAPLRKAPLGVADDALLGGLDIAGTLAAGRPVRRAGLLAEAAGGVLVLAMAERVSAFTAGRIAAAMDAKAGFALVALDEGLETEAPPRALLERLAFTVAAAGLPDDEADWPSAPRIAQARAALGQVAAGAAVIEQICGLCLAFGIDSLRAALFALRAARAGAALSGRMAVEPADIEAAARLVLVPRATRMPAPPAAEQPDETPDQTPDQPPPEETRERRPDEQEKVEDLVAAAEKAALPPELLAALAAASGPRRMARGAGTAGGTTSLQRGRPAGVRRGALGGAARLSVIETLRAAAPWQSLRRRHAPGRKILVAKDDFRIKRFKEQARTVAIFAVDASGSSAINRLAEAKGAIQMLLADCYVRRDQVALIAFRGRAAEILLPPTSALARAKRSLAGLPGGGPTPLATGIDAARVLADAERRAGKLPLIVLLTDGGANIARTGQPGRAAAGADALSAGRACRAANFAGLVVDTAPRPNKFVQSLAGEMGAKYLPLPYADAARLSRAVQSQSGAQNGAQSGGGGGRHARDA